MTSVSAVIPTIGRPSLLAAVDSCLGQGPAVAEVLVVVDGGEHEEATRFVLGDRIRRCEVLINARGETGVSARGMGTSQAVSDYIAYLDDDDVWLRGKVETQLAALQGLGPAVIACSAR